MAKTSRLSTDPTREPGSLGQLPTPIHPFHSQSNPFATTTNLIYLLLEDPNTPPILLDHLEQLFSQMGAITGVNCTPPTAKTVRRKLPLMLAKASRMHLSIRAIEWQYSRPRRKGGAR